jgi:hypothetical protein
MRRLPFYIPVASKKIFLVAQSAQERKKVDACVIRTHAPEGNASRYPHEER